ncbi:sensor histidine kinase [Ramlibacter sp. WS9]|uniref:sensor histidine kinase n=1 Tax=Ramlibacter sp. WS9 TaxID=1882741 RepID=UPI0013051B5F|nr:sensor histidine kinase [Ramlibacter sp. WS9]
MDGKSGTAVPRLAWSEACGPGSADDLLAPDTMDAMLAVVERLDPGELPAVHATMLHLPLLIGDDHLGGISALLAQTGQPSVAEIAWVQALAHQATLALRLDFLSTEREAAAVLKERARIAREIHDGIAQTLIGINRHLHGALAHTDCPAVASAIELAKDGLAEARRTMKALGPHQLSNMTFLDAVQEVARKVIPQQIEFLLSSTGTWPALPPERESNLFRVVQEAFNNVAKHSSATRLNLEVSSAPGEVSILIQDNGCGFDVRGGATGVGLANMRHRMDAIDGFFQLVSAPGSGTQVLIRLACA